MTTAQTVTYAQQVLQVDLDMALAGTESPAVSDWLIPLNQAQRILSRHLVLVDDITIALTAGTYNYNLLSSCGIVIPHVVFINQTPLRDAWLRRTGLLGLREFMDLYPAYKTASQGVPIAAAWKGRNGANDLLLYPPPNSTVAGQTNSVLGQFIPADITYSAPNYTPSTPVLPIETHEALAALAAVYAALPGATESEAWRRLGELRGGSYMGVVEEIRLINKQAVSYNSSGAGRYPFPTDPEPQPQGSPQ